MDGFTDAQGRTVDFKKQLSHDLEHRSQIHAPRNPSSEGRSRPGDGSACGKHFGRKFLNGVARSSSSTAER